ncbi:Crp/Fnr family transcriptional regulator [Urechidicola croceus]|uniref:Cyclic nucleotide-binding domain-containing protein n=1 Tax=Urechidicola croceus TaxID=1850246 RepID=A0A1D8P5D2_9FLAO|nr:Crp/Fnr family transcriptional regulator [Urechidicola croceus]AOW19802.1 hypothetical protein LPB138_03485 [Urechidicola croceus]
MFQNYLNRLNEINSISQESQEQLLEYTSVRKINKGEFILENGEVCKHIYFVNKGFVRIFYYKNGKDITEWFANENQFFFSIASYFENSPSRLIIEAVEDCEIIQLSKYGIDKLRNINIEIANLILQCISGSLIFSQKRMDSIQFETAIQRYNNLLAEQPKILNKVSLQHIASFLGITHETLSRIRAKI